MLPGSRSVYGWTMSMVTSPAPKGDDHAAADPAGDPGPRRPGRAGTPLPHHPRRHHPDPLPDRAAQRPRPYPTPDRAVGQVQRRHRASGAQPLFGRRRRRGAAPAAPWPAAPLSARLGAGVGPGGRSGPARGGGGQRVVDVSAAGRLPAPGDRVSGRDRDGADRVAPGGVCVQAAPLGAVAQGAGPAGVGKKRLRVEALLGAAASPVPPPAADLVPDATLADALMPEDLPRLLGLLERADLYLQDEVEVALHPTLTRVWSRAGRAGQRLVQAPGKNFKRCGFGLVDWRDGHLDFQLADGRRAVPFCEQLVLVYTPTYDPDANRIEWLWRALRRGVTHTHQRQVLQDLLADADRWARTITPAQVLAQIGSPFALDHRPVLAEELNHAA